MTRTARHTRAAFTLMELLMSILVIFLLMGMLIVGLRYARRSAQGARDTAMVTSLRKGVDHFKNEFGFAPPLVRDFEQSTPPVRTVNSPIAGMPQRNVPYVYGSADANILRRTPVSPWTDWFDPRFSTSSLPYYLIGALEVPGDPTGNNTTPVDGVAGLGFLTPRRDGSFEKTGRRFEPFFDLGKSSKAIFTVNANEGRIELRDANNIPVRYYRWLPGNPNNGNRVAVASDSNVPYILYLDPVLYLRDTSSSPLPKDQVPPNLLSAEWAVVAAGPNGVFGDEPELWAESVPALHNLGMDWPALASKVGLNDDGSADTRAKIRLAAMKDNVVEAGK